MNIKILIGVVVVGGLFVLINLSGKKENASVIENTETRTKSETVIPAGIPAHVPMYPDSILARTQDQTNEETGERNITLTLETPDSVADVNTWYRGALNANGWAVTGDKNVGGYILLEGENENIKVFTQSANGENRGAVITQRIRIR